MSVFVKLIAFFTAFVSVLSSPAVSNEKHETVSVMSFNLHCTDLCETRFNALCEQIREVEPDSLGIQELKNDSRDYFRNNLSEYDSYIAVGSRDEYVAIYWLKDEYRLIDRGSIFLSETPDRKSKGWDASLERMMCWVLLENRQTGFRYIHANTHLDHKGKQSREEAVKLLDKTLKAFDYPVVITGDFNCDERSNAIRYFTACGWADSMRLSGITQTTGSYHGYKNIDFNSLPIDFIFVKGAQSADNWRILKNETYNGGYPSDHFPVAVNLGFDYTITAQQEFERKYTIGIVDIINRLGSYMNGC